MNMDHHASDDAIDVARQLIRVPSENPPGDETQIGETIVRLLRRRGVEDVAIVAGLPSRPNVIARLHGERPGRTLLLCGHVDTKPAGRLEDWRCDPFAGVLADGRLYGLGASDMKSGVAAIIAAMGALQRQRLRAGTIVGVFTADEEAGSAAGARFLAESGYLEADAAVITEAAGIDRDWERLFIGTRGSLLFRVDLNGATGHSSLEDHIGGTSATMAAAELILQLDSAFRRIAGVAVNVGATIEGGTHYAVRPGFASFRGDVRIPPGMAVEDARAILNETVGEFRARRRDVTASVVTDELASGPFEPIAVAPDIPIVEACRTAAQAVLGRSPPDGIFPGGTDSFFVQGMAGIPTVPAFGPGCLTQAHQANESVSIESVRAAPRLLVHAAATFLDEAR